MPLFEPIDPSAQAIPLSDIVDGHFFLVPGWSDDPHMPPKVFMRRDGSLSSQPGSIDCVNFVLDSAGEFWCSGVGTFLADRLVIPVKPRTPPTFIPRLGYADPFAKEKAIRRGELDDEMPGFSELTGWLQRVPTTWLPGLLARTICMCVVKGVFKLDKLAGFVTRTIE